MIGNTSCWNCSAVYPIDWAECPQCLSVNANINFLLARRQMGIDQSGSAQPAPATPAEPVAWMFPRRYGSGLSFKRPADYEDAEGNIVRPTPLYTIGGQGHEAAARCSITSIASSEATCLNTEPSGRIGSDIQQGKLDADAGSIPAPPTPSPDPTPADDLVRVLNNVAAGLSPDDTHCLIRREVAAKAAARIEQDGERIAELDKQWRNWGTIEVAIRNPSVAESMRHWEGRAERAEAEVAKLRRCVEAARVMRADNDCPMCDRGKLRNPEKEHWDTCAFAAFDAALADANAR